MNSLDGLILLNQESGREDLIPDIGRAGGPETGRSPLED